MHVLPPHPVCVTPDGDKEIQKIRSFYLTPKVKAKAHLAQISSPSWYVVFQSNGRPVTESFIEKGSQPGTGLGEMILSSLSRVMSNICTESYHFQEDWLRDHVLQTELQV